MDALAAESFLNAEHRIYGRRMLPLSLGHAFTLEALGNPFYHGHVGQPEELRLAAWICSLPPLALPQTDGWRFRLWRWGTAENTFLGELQAWRAYVADYIAPPQLWNKVPKAGESRPTPSKVPNNLLTVVRLMRLGMTEQQAWSTPVGVAAWYEAASYETEGGRLDLVTDDERLAILKSKAKGGNSDG